MKIKKVIIQRKNENREFIFDDKINLIYSKENSKGKTTFLRAILFGFGYNIPATDGIKTFDDFKITVEFIEKTKKYKIERSGDIVYLYINDDKLTYIMPEQINELHAEIFNILDIMVLNNLLAIFYIDQIIGQLSRRKQKLIEELHEVLSDNNKYLGSIYETIKKYSKELDIEAYIKDNQKFVLTNQLKGKTGRILTQMSFAFKMAYVTEIKRKYGLILPLIIDSPRTNELTDEASTAMLKILETDFDDHQVILASVYEFEKIKKKVIEMKENLFY